MPLQLAVTDANIFIDLHQLDLTEVFFGLDVEIHTTSAVLYELHAEQQQRIHVYINQGKLRVHNLQEQDFLDIHAANYPRSLSEADKSVLHIANQIHACVLSSDKTLRNCAKNKGIEYHGMIWLFDKFVDSGLLTKQAACKKLDKLVTFNFMFRTNTTLMHEIEKRRALWT